MKCTSKKCLTLLFGLLLRGPIFAADFPTNVQPDTPSTQTSVQEPSFEVGMYRVKNSLTMNILIEKKLGDRVNLKLIDQKGNVLFEDAMGVKSQKYGRKLNFSQSEDGAYSLIVTNGRKEVVKEIQLSTHKLYEMPTRTLMAVQ